MKKISIEKKAWQQLRNQISTILTCLKIRPDMSWNDFLQDTYGACLCPLPVQSCFGAYAPKGKLRIAKAYNYTLPLN